MTVYTQLDAKRLYRLEKLASSVLPLLDTHPDRTHPSPCLHSFLIPLLDRQVELPIHAAIFYDGTDAVRDLLRAYHAASKPLQRSVTLHLVQPEHRRAHTAGSWIGRQYPIQELRNLALLGCTSRFVLYVEADMHFGPEAGPWLEKEATRLAGLAAGPAEEGRSGSRIASIVPLYQLEPAKAAVTRLPDKANKS